jgi:hypothetical protein
MDAFPVGYARFIASLGLDVVPLAQVARIDGRTRNQERITHAAARNTGYNCSEGEIRHHNTSKQIAERLCNRSSATNPHGAHVAEWRTLDSYTSARGTLTNEVDLNSVARINDEVMVVTRLPTVESIHVSYDCKGYYKTQGAWGIPGRDRSHTDCAT